MATNWPNSVQTFTNPTSGSALNSPSHADQHATVNDTVEALQTYAGLVFVKSVTIGSGVGSVTVTDAFDSRFTNYLMTGWFSLSSSTTVALFNFGGITGSVYRFNVFYIATGATGAESNSGGLQTYWDIGHWRYGGSMFIGKPYETGYKNYSFPPNTDVTYTRRGSGKCESTVQATSFTITPATGTFTDGILQIYGYNEG